MNTTPDNLPELSNKRVSFRAAERGAALVTAILMLGLLSAIALTVLAVVQTETRVAGSDLCRTQTFYAASSGIEKMTTDFGLLFAKTSVTNQGQYDVIAASPPDLTSDGYAFTQSLSLDQTTLDAMRLTASVTAPTYPTVSVNAGPLAGLKAAVIPYIMNTTATSACSQVTLERKMNNYLVPIFQFGMFSNEDMEIHPGVQFTFNGRVHANGNLYVNGVLTFQDKVTTAGEVVRDVLRNSNAVAPAAGAATHTGTVTFTKAGFTTTLDEANIPGNCSQAAARCASVILGPNVGGNDVSSPVGTVNPDWKTNSVSKFGNMLLTKSTGVVPLLLPLQLDNNPTRELIKRRLIATDSTTLSDSRYHSKSEIRILLDDEVPASVDAAGIPAGQGVALSTFNPIPMPNLATSAVLTANGGGRSLWRVLDANTGIANSYGETATSYVMQFQQTGAARQADTVRGVRAAPATKPIQAVTKTTGNVITVTCNAHGFVTGDFVVINAVVNTAGPTANNAAGNTYWPITVVNANSFTLTGSNGGGAGTYTANTGTALKLERSVANNTVIPYGAGITGRILIEVARTVGTVTTTFDVTREVLSMGVTEGEPNSVVALQRPLWAAYTQGSRDSSGLTNPALNGDPIYTNALTDILDNTHLGADGEITTLAGLPLQDVSGYLTGIRDDTLPGVNPARSDVPSATGWNSFVPINLYNVREGRTDGRTLIANDIYERGMTSIVEINMRNIARWVDGVYDNNLLAGTNAISGNIGNPDGYIVYVSDRRGDRVKSEILDAIPTTVMASNGMADNEEIYPPYTGVNGAAADPGTDVIDFLAKKGTLQKDVLELPVPAHMAGITASPAVVAAVGDAGFVLRKANADAVAGWKNPSNYFRRAVRLFNGEDLNPNRAGGTLLPTKGITIASENMVYIWGNYNTNGITAAPAANRTCLNDGGASGGCFYTGDQVPASIICDAFFPLSKTWFDGMSGMYPDDFNKRPGDRALPGGVAGEQAETSVRAGIIAGNNLSALSALTGTGADAGNYSATADSNESRLNGGIHNFPRFLEAWSKRFNFVGSLIPLWHSTQAMGQYQNQGGSSVYNAPMRDWAFDITFAQPDKLPPGTPQFQYTEPTAFRQIMY